MIRYEQNVYFCTLTIQPLLDIVYIYIGAAVVQIQHLLSLRWMHVLPWGITQFFLAGNQQFLNMYCLQDFMHMSEWVSEWGTFINVSCQLLQYLVEQFSTDYYTLGLGRVVNWPSQQWACRRQQTLHYQSRNKYWEGISSPELQDTLQSDQLPGTAPSNTHYMTMTKDRLRAAATNLFCFVFFAAMADREELGC